MRRGLGETTAVEQVSTAARIYSALTGNSAASSGARYLSYQLLRLGGMTLTYEQFTQMLTDSSEYAGKVWSMLVPILAGSVGLTSIMYWYFEGGDKR